jgi:hypothetical protein
VICPRPLTPPSKKDKLGCPAVSLAEVTQNIAGADVGSDPTLIPDTLKHGPSQAPKFMAISLPAIPD